MGFLNLAPNLWKAKEGGPKSIWHGLRMRITDFYVDEDFGKIFIY